MAKQKKNKTRIAEIKILKTIAVGEWLIVLGSLLTAIAATIAIRVENEENEEDFR